MKVEKLYQDKKWLEKKYVEEKLSKSEISKLCNLGTTTVLYWLKKFNIPRRPPSEALKGIVFSEEHIKNMSESQKGHIPWNKGKTNVYSKKTIQRMSKSNTKYGEENSHWKGGITPKNLKIRNSIELRLWREAVFARDRWTCQDCGKIGGKLRAHHILNFSTYPELRTAIDNGITLCERCHKKEGLHKGIVKTNEENN